MANLECVNFCLKTTSINASTVYTDYYPNKTVSTSTGIISNNRHTITWFNVNIRNILGPMFDKYDRFNLCLNSYAQSATGSTPLASQNEALCHIYFSGLPFTSTYNQDNGIFSNSIIFRQIILMAVANSVDHEQFSDKTFFTFSKTCDNVNITIDLKKVSTGLYPNYSSVDQLHGHMVFNFSIYGVEEYRVLKK
jgi:hypothetical protein